MPITEYAIMQIVEMLAPGLIAIGVGVILVGTGITLRALLGGSRKRLNDVTERLLGLESMVKRNRLEATDTHDQRVSDLQHDLEQRIRVLETIVTSGKSNGPEGSPPA